MAAVGIDKRLIASVNSALTTFESRPAEPAALDGPTAEELEELLSALPAMPDGDLEPAKEVTSLVERWRNAAQRLAAHDENEPTSASGRDLGAPAPEIRRLADEVELPIPEVDAVLATEVERRRAVAAHPPAPTPVAPTAAVVPSRPSVPALAMGGAAVVAGVGLVAIGQPIVGALVVLVGVAISVALMRSTSAGSAPVAATEPPVVAEAPPDDELPRLEARLALQQEAQLAAEGRRERALTRLAELGLQPEPDELRRAAADAETSATIDVRHTQWKRRRAELEAAQSEATEGLAAALATRGFAPADRDGVDEAAVRYAQACRDRAEVAREARRRDDLEAQLVSRLAAETARDAQRTARREAAAQLRAVAAETGCDAPTEDGLVKALRGWVAQQEQLDQTREQREQLVARLEQALDGATIDELADEVGSLRAEAGEEPGDDTPLRDRSAELKALQERAQERRDRLSELVGRLEGAESHLLDVSAAIEAEARAAAEVARLAQLADDLDVAGQILGAAQDKVHADIAPVLNELIRPWVPRITRGRYDDIRIKPATLEIEAQESAGQFRAATVLSHGTTEQLFLLLRLALAQRLTTTGESAPIVLDDITVQSDADRTLAALDLLHELSVDHQIILFSQEEEVRRWAEHHLTGKRDRYLELAARS
jgi:exonuclease SbcC